MFSVNKVFPFHSDVVLNYSILQGTSEALKFSDLGAEIGKCNVAPKVEVSMCTKILKSIFNAKCILDNFSCFCFRLPIFFQNKTFFNKSFRNTIRV